MTKVKYNTNMKTKTTGIYKITERSTGKCYIGQSKNIEGRWKKHHKRFPPSGFDYDIIRTTENAKFSNAFEKYYINFYDSHRNGFNKTVGGSGIKVIFVDENTRKKLSAAKTGKKASAEAKVKMSAAKTGRPKTAEHKANISAAKKNAPTFQCPHCPKSCKATAFKRYHGDNCKMKPKENENGNF